MKNRKKGFTLVELLVVIAIVAILATVTIVGYSAFVNKANESKAKSELNQIVSYVNAEFADDGKWGELDKSTMEANDLQSKINGCDDFSGLSKVTVTEANGVFTISYTVGNITVTDTLK